MKSRHPQISQITQMLSAATASVGCKEYQADAFQGGCNSQLHARLCNL
jgi:hypothetical protein